MFDVIVFPCTFDPEIKPVEV